MIMVYLHILFKFKWFYEIYGLHVITNDEFFFDECYTSYLKVLYNKKIGHTCKINVAE